MLKRRFLLKILGGASIKKAAFELSNVAFFYVKIRKILRGCFFLIFQIIVIDFNISCIKVFAFTKTIRCRNSIDA